MKCVGKNFNLRLFYKTNQLEDSANVWFNIWDDDGNALITNGAAIEIGSEGVYYFDFNTPNSDLYLLIIGANDGASPQPEIIKVGNPSERVFYVQGNYLTGKAIAYEFYDENDVVLNSGTLTDIVSGFYAADSSGLTEPWFFEVYPLVSRNQACFNPE